MKLLNLNRKTYHPVQLEMMLRKAGVDLRGSGHVRATYCSLKLVVVKEEGGAAEELAEGGWEGPRQLQVATHRAASKAMVSGWSMCRLH